MAGNVFKKRAQALFINTIEKFGMPETSLAVDPGLAKEERVTGRPDPR